MLNLHDLQDPCQACCDSWEECCYSSFSRVTCSPHACKSCCQSRQVKGPVIHAGWLTCLAAVQVPDADASLLWVDTFTACCWAKSCGELTLPPPANPSHPLPSPPPFSFPWAPHQPSFAWSCPYLLAVHTSCAQQYLMPYCIIQMPVSHLLHPVIALPLFSCLGFPSNLGCDIRTAG